MTLARRLRAEMPVAERWAYFDHAAMSPCPGRRRKRSRSGSTRRWTTATPVWPEWVKRDRSDAGRGGAADWGAIATKSRWCRNTTAGISLVAEGIDWRPGDNVVTLADEFPSNVYPWFNLASRGVETRRVPTDERAARSRALSGGVRRADADRTVSWIGYATGYRHDVRADRRDRPRARGADDARRDSGPRRVSARRERDGDRFSRGRRAQVDARARGGRHRVHSPRTSGQAAADRRRLAQRGPLGTTTRRSSSTCKPTAARYEGGSQNKVGMLAFGASLDLLLELASRIVAASILDITDRACERLQRSARRSFPIAGRSSWRRAALGDRGVRSGRAAIRWR